MIRNQKRFAFGIVGLLFVFGFSPPSVYAWQISNFEVRVDVRKDSSALVQETIIADFTGESRHGIYRDIPIHYQDVLGQHFKMRLSVESVADQTGQPWKYKLERAGLFLRIRIGDPDILLTGFQTYRLTYRVDRGAVRFFPEHEECYWNLIGNGWAVPIARAYGEINVPAGAQNLRAVAYKGVFGSAVVMNDIRRSGHLITFEPRTPFNPYEGLTAVVGWDKGGVTPPSFVKKIRWWFQDNLVFSIPIVVFLVMFRLWILKGREFRQNVSEVVSYEAPGQLSPAEMGTLLDQKVDMRDITATVIDLARRGYLTIQDTNLQVAGLTLTRDYVLTNTKDWEGAPDLKNYERDILKSIFTMPMSSTKLSDLKEVFYKDLPDIRNHIYGALIKKGYLDSNPQTIRTTYQTGAGVFGCLIFFGLVATVPYHFASEGASILIAVLSGLIVSFFGFVMPRRTLQGAGAFSQIMGYEEFLRRTDEDRIRRMNDPGLFEKCLPYALAFGISDTWARTFQGIYKQSPSWYVGSSDHFSTVNFNRNLGNVTSSMSQAFASAPRASSSGFGGGGFSGGGGGGGGGGAW